MQRAKNLTPSPLLNSQENIQHKLKCVVIYTVIICEYMKNLSHTQSSLA